MFTQVASNIKGFARKFARVLCEWGLNKHFINQPHVCCRARLPSYVLDFGHVVLGTVRTQVVRATNTGWFPVSFSLERDCLASLRQVTQFLCQAALIQLVERPASVALMLFVVVFVVVVVLDRTPHYQSNATDR